MDIYDYSFIFKLIILFVTSMLVILGCCLILRKINHTSDFLFYSYDFPYWKKYNKRKHQITAVIIFCSDFLNRFFSSFVFLGLLKRGPFLCELITKYLSYTKDIFLKYYFSFKIFQKTYLNSIKHIIRYKKTPQK